MKWSMSTVRSQAVTPMSLCIDGVAARRGHGRGRAGDFRWSVAGSGPCAARAGALELHEHESGRDRVAVRALAALVALLLDASRAFEHVGQHAGQLVPALLVECQCGAAEVNVGAVEATRRRGAAKVI